MVNIGEKKLFYLSIRDHCMVRKPPKKFSVLNKKYPDKKYQF